MPVVCSIVQRFRLKLAASNTITSTCAVVILVVVLGVVGPRAPLVSGSTTTSAASSASVPSSITVPYNLTYVLVLLSLLVVFLQGIVCLSLIIINLATNPDARSRTGNGTSSAILYRQFLFQQANYLATSSGSTAGSTAGTNPPNGINTRNTNNHNNI